MGGFDHEFNHVLYVRVGANGNDLNSEMRVMENSKYFIRERLPYIFNTLKIQKHFGKLIESR